MNTQQQKDRQLAIAMKSIDAARANLSKAEKAKVTAKEALEQASAWVERASGALQLAHDHKTWVQSMPVAQEEAKDG